jgi:hypothetical protein
MGHGASIFDIVWDVWLGLAECDGVSRLECISEVMLHIPVCSQCKSKFIRTVADHLRRIWDVGIGPTLETFVDHDAQPFWKVQKAESLGAQPPVLLP